MREIFKKYGLARTAPSRSVRANSLPSLQADTRKTLPLGPRQTFAIPVITVGPVYERRRMRRRVIDLINLSESAVAARAIRKIRNAVCSLEWTIQPKNQKDPEAKSKSYDDARDVVKQVLEAPNVQDDDFPAFIGQILEDILIFDAGVWEYVDRPQYIENNNLLSLEVVPGYTIARNRNWIGDPNKPRWIQVLDDGKIVAVLLDREIEYVMYHRRSFDPFGLSPLETALEVMDALINLQSYQRQIASDAYPPNLIYLGDNVEEDQRRAFKYYWDNELKGRGTPGFFGGMGETAPSVLQLKPSDDTALFLNYHELLIRVMASCFDLHPQDLNLERDVNRNTSEVAESATLREAILPLAHLIQIKINRHILPRIAEVTGNQTIRKMEFFYTNLSPEDELRQSQLNVAYAGIDALTMDEIRGSIDADPYPNDLGKLPPSAFKAVLDTDPFAMLRDNIDDLVNPPEPETEPNPEEQLPMPGDVVPVAEPQGPSEEQKLAALKTLTARLKKMNL